LETGADEEEDEVGDMMVLFEKVMK